MNRTIKVISIFKHNKIYHAEFTNFSDGAVSVNLSSVPVDNASFAILVSPLAPASMVRDVLEQTIDALYQMDLLKYCTNISLPYLPYARADRVFKHGDSNPLKTFVNWVVYVSDLYDLPRFSILEPHNFSAIPEKLKDYFLVDWIDSCIEKEDYQHITSVIAPDEGAVNRAERVAELLGVKVSAVAKKQRDMSTGKIVAYKLDVTSDIGVQPLVVDDIIDGGRTFIELADAIKAYDKTIQPHLLVAFGIFSNAENNKLLAQKYKTISAIYDWEA